MLPVHRKRPLAALGKALERLARRLALGVVRWAWRVRRAPEIPREPGAILVVRTDDRVGNVLLTTPLLAELRRAFPRAKLTLLMAARQRVLLEGWPVLDAILPYDRRAALRPWKLIRLLRALRAVRADIAFDASHWHAVSLTSVLLTRASGAKVSIGFAKPGIAGLLTHPVPLPDPEIYDATARLALLVPLGVASSAHALHTVLGQEPAALLASAGLAARGFIAVNVGGRKEDHRLDVPAWAALLAALAERMRLPALLLWGPGEQPLAEELARAAPAKVAPATGLADLAGLLRAAALVVATDTGPLHLAVALGAPTIGLYTRPDWRRWASPAPTFRAVSTAEAGWPARAAGAAETLLGLSAAVQPQPKERASPRPR